MDQFWFSGVCSTPYGSIFVCTTITILDPYACITILNMHNCKQRKGAHTMANAGKEGVTPFQKHQGEINNGIAELAERIRATTQEQVETWRLLPYLALRAEGISDFRDTAYHMYQYGMLRVGGGNAMGLIGTFIDCESGDIRSLRGPSNLDIPATDLQVVEAWLPNGDAFDAQQQLEEYQERANKPLASETHERNIREWQDSRIKNLGLILEPEYVRTDVAPALELEAKIRHL